MSTALVLIGVCALTTVAIKAIGPVALGGRALPGWFDGVITLMAPAVLAALVVTQSLADGDHLAVGARTAGVAAATAIAWRTGSIVLCVLAAAVVTAALRAV